VVLLVVVVVTKNEAYNS